MRSSQLEELKQGSIDDEMMMSSVSIVSKDKFEDKGNNKKSSKFKKKKERPATEKSKMIYRNTLTNEDYSFYYENSVWD